MSAWSLRHPWEQPHFRFGAVGSQLEQALRHPPSPCSAGAGTGAHSTRRGQESSRRVGDQLRGEEAAQQSHTGSVGAAREKSCHPPAEHTRKAAASCRSPEEAAMCCLHPVQQSLAFLLQYGENKGLFSLYK